MPRLSRLTVPTTIGRAAGLQSSRPLQGRTTFDSAEASLTPISFEANARQTYSVPFARSRIRALVLADVMAVDSSHVAPPSAEHS